MKNRKGGIIMKITVCIGSSCHVKGSRQVVETLQYLIAENDLKDQIDLSGTFCMKKFRQGFILPASA